MNQDQSGDTRVTTLSDIILELEEGKDTLGGTIAGGKALREALKYLYRAATELEAGQFRNTRETREHLRYSALMQFLGAVAGRAELGEAVNSQASSMMLTLEALWQSGENLFLTWDDKQELRRELH